MGLLNNIKDAFNKSEFTVAPNKKLKKVGEAEKMFDKAFGVTVQIKDKSGKILVPNDITIGQAARGEYK